MTASRLVARLALVLCLAASTQGLLFVQASFALNQDWIARTLCVNRDRPEKKCNGRCVLRRHLEAHDHEHDDGRDLAVLRVALSIAPLLAEAPALVTSPAGPARPYGGSALLAAASGWESDVFRPPREG